MPRASRRVAHPPRKLKPLIESAINDRERAARRRRARVSARWAALYETLKANSIRDFLATRSADRLVRFLFGTRHLREESLKERSRGEGAREGGVVLGSQMGTPLVRPLVGGVSPDRTVRMDLGSAARESGECFSWHAGGWGSLRRRWLGFGSGRLQGRRIGGRGSGRFGCHLGRRFGRLEGGLPFLVLLLELLPRGADGGGRVQRLARRVQEISLEDARSRSGGLLPCLLGSVGKNGRVVDATEDNLHILVRGVVVVGDLDFGDFLAEGAVDALVVLLHRVLQDVEAARGGVGLLHGHEVETGGGD
eukprot:885751-Prorocentrum_minimum.AAC.1